MNFSDIQTKYHKVLLFLATVYAIVYGLTTYLWLALQLFWEEHGDTILTGLVRFVFSVTEVSREVFLLGRDCRKLVNRSMVAWSDRAYFYSAGFYS